MPSDAAYEAISDLLFFALDFRFFAKAHYIVSARLLLRYSHPQRMGEGTTSIRFVFLKMAAMGSGHRFSNDLITRAEG